MDEALSVGWELEEAEKTLERNKLSRIDILYRHLGDECVAGCAGQWIEMAKEVLDRNNIRREDFAQAVRTLLEKGRGKYRNVYLKGPCNCAKTFLLNPLNTVFKTFSNPASTTFAWLGAQEAEVVFLNDFRWSAQIILGTIFSCFWRDRKYTCQRLKLITNKTLSLKGTHPFFAPAKMNFSSSELVF